jgi:hypothetical protein
MVPTGDRPQTVATTPVPMTTSTVRRLVLTAEGLEGITLGMSWRDALAYGLTPVTKATAACRLAIWPGLPGVTVAAVDDRVVAVTAHLPGVYLRDWQVGDAFAWLKATTWSEADGVEMLVDVVDGHVVSLGVRLTSTEVEC